MAAGRPERRHTALPHRWELSTRAMSSASAASAAQAVSFFAKFRETRRSLDVAFILLSASLVFVMQIGFAMLTVGSIRTKNAKNVLLKNVLDACVGVLAFFLFGWSLAFGPDGNSFAGWGQVRPLLIPLLRACAPACGRWRLRRVWGQDCSLSLDISVSAAVC